MVSDVGVPFVVNMDDSLASVLVANLLKNAFLHNVDGGEVRVTTGSRVLRVENTASGGPLDDSKIFERFWHAAGSKSSTGLGLALVKAVCRLYGMSVRYGFESGRHVFEITACEK